MAYKKNHGYPHPTSLSHKQVMDALVTLGEIAKKHGLDGPMAEVMARSSELLGQGLTEMENALLGSLDGASKNVSEVCGHIIEAGGKRIRPVICMLSYRAARGADLLPLDLAMSCELLHNSTLLHDDVIDEGDVRRGRPSARVAYGNALSILGGDYLLMRCVEIVAQSGSRYMPPFVETLRMLVEGEVVQLRLRGSVNTTEKEYLEIIEGKTASLFRWAANAGAMAADADKKTCEALGLFGRNVGMAFQLIDDVLDLSADAQALGKDLLADIGEGKMTLPVILAAERCDDLKPMLAELAAGGDAKEIVPGIIEFVDSSNAIEDVKALAAEHHQKGIEALAGITNPNIEIIDVLTELSSALILR